MQDLLLFDKRAVAFDPTWTKGRWPCGKNNEEMWHRYLAVFVMEHSQRPIVGGSRRISSMTMCVSGGATKANKLRQTWISADVCRNATLRRHFCWLEPLYSRMTEDCRCICSFDARNTNLVQTACHEFAKIFSFWGSAGLLCTPPPEAYHTQSRRRLQSHCVRAALSPEATGCWAQWKKRHTVYFSLTNVWLRRLDQSVLKKKM